jgi:trigger factor
MKVTQEKLPSSQLGLEIEISPETSKNIYEKVVQNLARSSNIPGFRKGKVPRQILVQRIGTQRIKAAALEELVQTGLKEALEEEAIEALGNYQLRSNFEELLDKYNPGEAIVIKVAIDVPPTVELQEYKGLSVKAEEVTYDPQQVEKVLEERRSQKADLIPVENRPAQKGDLAIIDFSGILVPNEGEEAQAIEGGKAENFQVELVEGRLIEGMIEGIFGMNVAETKEVAVTFPTDYPKEDLAGKAAVFTITLKELKEKDLPELDDDFAQDISEFETIAELKESLEKEYQEKAQKDTNKNIYSAIISELVKNSLVDIPETLIQEEVTNVLSQTFMQMQQLGIDLKKLFNPENIPKMRENARPEAVQNLVQNLIIGEIGKRESLEPTQEAIEAKIKEVRTQLSGQDLDLDKLRQVVAEDLLRENTLSWLKGQSTVELVPQGTLQEKEEKQEEQQDQTAD